MTHVKNNRMKKIYILFPLLLLGIMLLNSCQKEMDDYFDKSASERMENEIVKYRDLLIKPQHGWIMEYYPGGTNQAFGGFALAVKFNENGEAVFQSSTLDDVSATAKSLYSLKKDVGPTLNFDTYNDIFHYFSDPDVGSADGVGRGWVGDYEFILQSGTDSEIIMYGKKHGAAIHMYPLQEPATEYLSKAKQRRESYQMIPAVEGLTGTFADRVVKAELITSQHFVLTQDDQQVRVSFMFTDKGVKLYAPFTLNGVTVSELEWKPEERAFVSPDGILKLSLKVNPLGLRLDQLLGNYTFYYSNKMVDVSISLNQRGAIVMEGLPFNVIFTYNTKKGALELQSQQLLSTPDVLLAIWQAGSYLAPFLGPGLLTQWNGSESNFVLTFTDNDYVWTVSSTRVRPNAFIIWQMNVGQYYGFGDSQYMNLRLTKK